MSSAAREGLIYGLSCLCHPEDGIRYVGQTVVSLRRRLNAHIWAAFRDEADGKRLVPSQRWIIKHGGSNIVAQEIETGNWGIDLDEKEKYWISRLESALNIRPGGNSIAGWKQSDEARLKISASKLGVKRGPLSETWRKNIGDANRGKKRTEEAKKNISLGKMGKKPTPEHSANRLRSVLENKTYCGESNGKAKLTEKDARSILFEFESVSLSDRPKFYRETSGRFGVSYSCVYSLCTGKTWLHLR